MTTNTDDRTIVYGKPATHLTYQANEYQSISVYAWGVYPQSSVLAGQPCKKFIDMFDDVETALAAYPQAGSSHPLIEPQNTFDHLPDGPDDGFFDHDDY
ncbi:hypothetical protein [Vibrio fluvialis]|uniref:hypothetical protein n=1 Tax=Vibrio fluvialis TaxID=676 RepID=UPI0023A996EE|nr:hypothetical protein [Vibrio fluvialis]MDE5179200.1 hypothetical protein [Vibrio fluvialis]